MNSRRFATILCRYGWRSPFVVLVLALRVHFNLCRPFRAWKFGLLTTGLKGQSLQLGKDVLFTPGSHVSVGTNVRIGDRTNLEVYVNPCAKLEIGSDVWLSHDCHICALDRITIGSGVLVGEFVSIRDSMHKFSAQGAIIHQGDNIGVISIGDDVWIGRGSIIIGRPDGTNIGKGAIIGANSVVSRSIPPGEVWAGVPAAFIKRRE